MSFGFGVRQSNSRSGASRPKLPLAILAHLTLALSACGATPPSQASGAKTDSAEPASGDIANAHFALLSSTCTVTTAGIAIQVNANELAIVSLSSATGNVAVNGNQANGSPCEAAPTSAITITPGTAGDHGVYLDLSNGLFSMATAANAPKIRLTLGTGSNDTLTVRGSAGVDRFYFGKGSAANTYLFNFNGGGASVGDSLPDVSIFGAEHVVVNGGAGADVLDGTGLFGTVAPYPTALSLYGGADDDALNGGAGDDILSGDAGNDQLIGGKGANTYTSGSSNDGNDVVSVTPGAIDTVDYSQRFNSVTLTLNNAAVSGENGEQDTIPDTVSVVIGGSGNDSLSAVGSTRAHTLMGGPGNDTLIGGSGGDLLDGGNGVLQVDGDDVFIGSRATATYLGRTEPLTLTINGAGNGGADANDGDPATARHVQTATGAAPGATITAATNTVTGLVNMNAGSVGRHLIISGSAAAHDNGSYRISQVLNATTVVLNATDTGAKLTWADDVSAGWTFAEDADAERDEIRCQNVTGSATDANTITGDGNDNWITGGGVADTLLGGGGADTLIGLAGSDVLFGGAGDDTLQGGLGSDALHGGDGNDVLEGDDGDDSYECDGKNDPTTSGSAPGNTDYTVGYTPGTPDFDTRVMPFDCEH